MRQVFSSARLENVEGVAQLLREADIEVRITHGRSYKGNRRSGFSYREQDTTRPAVWVVKSDDQVRAREILRAAGLIETTRRDEAYSAPTFRMDTAHATAGGDPVRRRAFRIKMVLLAGIVIVAGMAITRSLQMPAAPALASPPFDGTPAATLPAVAAAVFQHEMAEAKLPVLCLAVDGRDAPAAFIDSIARKPFTTVPASHCRRIADSDRGSEFPPTGQPALILDAHSFRPTAADTATVEATAYHHQMYGSYKTLEVRYIDGAWRVTRTVRHVSMRG